MSAVGGGERLNSTTACGPSIYSLIWMWKKTTKIKLLPPSCTVVIRGCGAHGSQPAPDEELRCSGTQQRTLNIGGQTCRTRTSHVKSENIRLWGRSDLLAPSLLCPAPVFFPGCAHTIFFFLLLFQPASLTIPLLNIIQSVVLFSSRANSIVLDSICPCPQLCPANFASLIIS